MIQVAVAEPAIHNPQREALEVLPSFQNHSYFLRNLKHRGRSLPIKFLMTRNFCT